MDSLNEIMCVIKQGQEAGMSNDAICAAVSYEMARQEMETNKGYALGFEFLINNSSEEKMAEIAAKYGTDIMKDESDDHAVKLRKIGDWYSGIAPIDEAKVNAETEGI